MEFKKYMTALGIGSGQDIIHNNDNDDDDDDWDFDFIRKNFWDGIVRWTKSSSAANMVRFTVYSDMIKRLKPKVRTLIWGKRGNGGVKRIIRDGGGYASMDVEWIEPMEGMAWDSLIEECRQPLLNSDMYKAFGGAGKIGNAALLFKGDVLEFMVYICCAFTETRDFSSGSDLKGIEKASPFNQNMLKLVKDRYHKYLDDKISSKVGRIDLRLDRTSVGSQVYNGNIIFKLGQQFAFEIIKQ